MNRLRYLLLLSIVGCKKEQLVFVYSNPSGQSLEYNAVSKNNEDKLKSFTNRGFVCASTSDDKFYYCMKYSDCPNEDIYKVCLSNMICPCVGPMPKSSTINGKENKK